MFSFASSNEINEVRRSLLGSEEAERLNNSGEPFLLPAEDLIERGSQNFHVVLHPWNPSDSQGNPLWPHFGLVRDGTLEFSEWCKAEDRYLQLLDSLCAAGDGRSVVQVSYNVSPVGERSIKTYFSGEEALDITTLLQSLRHKDCNVIKVEDMNVLRLLMKLGVREIAMHTFAFPALGLCLVNHWDLRLLAYTLSPSVFDHLNRAVIDSGLRLRDLPSQ